MHCCSGPRCCDQRSEAEDGNQSLQLVGQDVETNLRPDVPQCLHEQVRRLYLGFQRAERVFYCLPADAHRVWPQIIYLMLN